MRQTPCELDEKIIEIVFKAIDDINQMLPREYRLAKSHETFVLGPSAVLDSMGFVNLIAAVEERIAAELGVTLSLLGREDRRGAFKTIGTLITCISKVIAAKAEGSIK